MPPIILHSASVLGGMVNRAEPFYLTENQTTYLLNSAPKRLHSRKRRNGVTSIGGRSDDPFGLFRAENTLYEQEVLYGAYGNQLYIVPGSGIVDRIACDASLTNGLHIAAEGYWRNRIANYISMAQVSDSEPSLASQLMAITDDDQYSQQSSMAPTCIAWYQFRLWCANNLLAQDEETLWYSSFNDGLSYSAFNTLRIEPGVGGRITGLLPLRGGTPGLLIFKERALAVLDPMWGSSAYIPSAADQLDTINTSVRVISKNVGCVATKSIQYIPGSQVGDIIFLSADGFRTIQRAQDDVVSGTSPPISDNIRDTIARINFSQAHKAVSAVHDSIYYCAVPLDGALENTHILMLDLLQLGWYICNWCPKDLTTARKGTETERLWLLYGTPSADCSNTGAFTGYHIFRAYDGLCDPGGVPILFQEDTRGFLPTGNIQQKSIWDSARITIKNEAQSTGTFGLLYNVDNHGWITLASLTVPGTILTVILGETPLPWIPYEATITTRKIALNDVPPGYTLQIRYLNQDFSIPSILDIAVKATPIEDETDNLIT